MHGPAHGTAPAAINERTFAIIGAGFSGTVLAIQLLRQRTADRTRVWLIDPRHDVGAGVAYATRDYPYPLNVAAGQMSLDSTAPRDFLEFACSQGIHATPGDYLPRQVYGEYLRTRFEEANAAAAREIACVHRSARVLQLRRGNDGRWDLWLDDGSALRADEVVLALGNPPPAALPCLAPIVHTAHYVNDPWSIGELAGVELDSVLLVGSGLTMIDAALRLAAIRPRVRHIHVLSRHGLLPLPQASVALPAIKPNIGDALASSQGSTRRLFAELRKVAREVCEAGGDWREVFAVLRSQIPALWHGLDHQERARFLRHARSAWEVHRHRVPAGPLAAVQSLARTGVLQVHAGRLMSVRLVDDSVEVSWRPRGSKTLRAWLVDRVINCTGPDHRLEHSPDPLVQSLLGNGLIRRDTLSLGLETTSHGEVISATGAIVPGLYYLGPWLRARDWEATAVPELREHAARLAQRLTTRAPAAYARSA